MSAAQRLAAIVIGLIVVIGIVVVVINLAGDGVAVDRRRPAVPMAERSCEVADRVGLARRMNPPAAARVVDDVEGRDG